MPKQNMLINYSGEECRIAIVEDGLLEELYVERATSEPHVGNIYRGRVTNVEPSIQAAFIDFGQDRNGFLHISDLHPRYFPGEADSKTERVGKKTPRRNRPLIQHALRRGQEVLVQVIKEGIGSKGPTLTSYLSIAGRYLVMMPGMERLGVSRKVEDDELRREMRKVLDELDPPREFGFIIRTAGMGRTKTELKRDLAYLQRVWKNIDKRMNSGKGPAELYIESDLVIRTMRDVLSNDVQRIIVDHPEAALRAREFLRIASPRSTTRVYYYGDPIPLFSAFGVEDQIDVIYSRRVPLPSGGSLVIDPTEAMVAIDVNSGKYRDPKDAAATAYKTNCEAVDEICRQLRLRDLGGLLVLDLIDMYIHKHRREIEKRMRDNLKRDRARSKVLRISELGMMEMTRQRMRPSLKTGVFDLCPNCEGSGHVRSPSAAALDLVRRLWVTCAAEKVSRVEVSLGTRVINALMNDQKSQLVALEEHYGKPIEIRTDPSRPVASFSITALDERGVAIDLEKLAHPAAPELTEADEVVPGQCPGESPKPAEPQAEEDAPEETASKKTRRRRRRRKSTKTKSEDAPPAEEKSEAPAAQLEPPPPPVPQQEDVNGSKPTAEKTEKKSKRRRGRRGSGKSKKAKAKQEAAKND